MDSSADAIPGFGRKTREALLEVGIASLDALRKQDAFDLYRRLKERDPRVSLNFLYAILAAQDGSHWRDVQRSRRTEIILRLDELGLAPK
jgi:DNA transformation protein and related proteins